MRSTEWENGLATLPGYIIETTQTYDGDRRHRELDEPMATQGSRQSSGLVIPFLIANRENSIASVIDDAMSTPSAAARTRTVTPLLDAVAPPVGAGGNHHVLVQGAALLSMRDTSAMHVGDLGEHTMTMTAQQQSALISTTSMPFLAPFYGQKCVSPVDEAANTMVGADNQALCEPVTLRAEDYFFRMLQPMEIGSAMAFPQTYLVGGTKRDQVKQYGNAITPPTMDWIVRRCAASLAPELDVSGYK